MKSLINHFEIIDKPIEIIDKPYENHFESEIIWLSMDINPEGGDAGPHFLASCSKLCKTHEIIELHLTSGTGRGLPAQPPRTTPQEPAQPPRTTPPHNPPHNLFCPDSLDTTYYIYIYIYIYIYVRLMHKVRMMPKHLGRIILMRQDDGPGTPADHAHHPEDW